MEVVRLLRAAASINGLSQIIGLGQAIVRSTGLQVECANDKLTSNKEQIGRF